MKTQSISRCFVAVFSLSFILQGSLLAYADEASCTAQDGTCTTPSKSWVDEVGNKAHQFLQEKIFGQQQADADAGGFLTLLAGGVNEKSEQKTNPFFSLLDRLAAAGIMPGMDEQTQDSSHSNDVINSLLERASLLNEEEQAITGLDFLGLIQEASSKAVQQLKNTFGDVMSEVDPSHAVAMVYFLAQEDARKNPSWKRRQHRFYDKVTKPVVLELHDALYLSQLAYVNSVKDFRKGLATFQNNTWELGYGTTESLPNMPAHFLLIHKKLASLSDPATRSILPWEGKKDSELQVTLVIRGTKYLSDAIADALLEPVEYRGGHAHGGCLESGKAFAEKYVPKLKDLLKHSGRDKIRLYLVGHSLGAAAAAIAAMEFKEYDFIDVEAVGFGCPSLLSRELSESTKDYITTVVSDADVVPRMSGASMANMLLDLLEYDWTDSALEDIEYSLGRAREVLPFGHLLPQEERVLQWAKDFVDHEIRPKFGKKKRDRMSSVLIPPGNCIHFFRDGVGYTGTYTPCSFFNSVDMARTLVDDHLVMPGYHRAFINIVRDWEQDYNVSTHA
jgi:hypothetical protein